jgi:hypothetical protein
VLEARYRRPVTGALPPGEDSFNTNVRLPRPLHKWLRHRAIDQDVTMADLIRRYILEGRARDEAADGKTPPDT